MEQITESFSVRQLRRRRLVSWAVAFLVLAVAVAKVAFFPSPDPDGDPRLLQVRQDLCGLAGALGIYLIDHGRYPTEREGLALLVREGSLSQIPRDPWSNPYEYSAIGSDPRDYRIRSLGADGHEGGVGLNADIVLETTNTSHFSYVLTDGTGTYRFSQQGDISPLRCGLR